MLDPCSRISNPCLLRVPERVVIACLIRFNIFFQEGQLIIISGIFFCFVQRGDDFLQRSRMVTANEKNAISQTAGCFVRLDGRRRIW